MLKEPPSFWWEKPGTASKLLMPAAWVYGRFAEKTLDKANPPQLNVPVLCIGNFTLGGTGKTPLAIAFARAAKKRQLKPAIISRGYGGAYSRSKRQLHKVDIRRDRARDVGDEPLLLAEYANVMIGVNRFAAAEKLVADGANFIIMDDGFQSRRLYWDYALLAVDATRGLGNGKVFPAGPLRAPLPVQLSYADSLMIIGGQSKTGSCAAAREEALIRLSARAGKPFYRAGLRSFISRAYEGGQAKNKKENDAAPIGKIRAVKGRSFLAFAGIGNPQKFYQDLEQAGGIVAQKCSFKDHHFFTTSDIENIVQTARLHKLVMVTTAKDYIRIKTAGLAEKLGDVLVLDIRLAFAQADFCDHILDICLRRCKERLFVRI